MHSPHTIVKLAASLGLCIGIWLFAIFFDAPLVEKIYLALDKPWLAPSFNLIPIIWGALFILLGIILFLIWKNSNKEGARPVLTLFLVELALIVVRNISFSFFPDLLSGFVIGMLMLVNAIVIAVLSWRIHRAIVWLMIPFIIGLTLFIVLNAFLMYMNR